MVVIVYLIVLPPGGDRKHLFQLLPITADCRVNSDRLRNTGRHRLEKLERNRTV
jgi:hypothetical protein